MDTSFTNSRDDVASARQPDVDWASLTRGERVRSLELEGYVVIPDLLSPGEVREIGEELARLPTTAVDYSEHQRGCSNIEWTDSPQAIGVIAQPLIVNFLEELFGDDIICTSCAYAVSQSGHPGIAVHTDAQPYGSQIFGVQSSSPCLVRVLYYLDDLTPERSPFKIIPRSHLSLHSDANPYKRYLAHDEELLVTCKAGSAVLINQKVFHGNFPNYSNSDRRMLAIAYRPAWAGPIGDEEDRDPKKIAGLPESTRKFFGSLNTRNIEFDLPNRPDNMARSAPGINPSRWNSSAD